MNQNIWGPRLWTFLHIMSFNYPIVPTQKDKQHYETFVDSLQYILPCSVCRKNFKRNLRAFPPQLNSRKAFVYWLIDIHNEVNSMTGKKRLSYNHVVELYEKKLNKKLHLGNISLAPKKRSNKNTGIILLVIALMFFVFVKLR